MVARPRARVLLLHPHAHLGSRAAPHGGVVGAVRCLQANAAPAVSARLFPHPAAQREQQARLQGPARCFLTSMEERKVRLTMAAMMTTEPTCGQGRRQGQLGAWA